MMLQQSKLEEPMGTKMERQFLLNGSASRGSTDRSSSSPSNDDDLNDLMEDDVNQKEEDEESLARRVAGLENKFVYIQHQLASIMTHIHATPCSCCSCKQIGGQPKSNFNASEMLSKLFPNASNKQLSALLDLSKVNRVPTSVVKEATSSGSSGAPLTSARNSETSGTAAELKLGQGYTPAAVGGGGKIQTERLSEPAKKSRKFGAYPPTATYYQRKESGNPLIPPTSINSIPNLTAPAVQNTSANTSTASPGPSSDGDRDEHIEMPQDVAAANLAAAVAVAPQNPGSGTNLFAQSMVDILKLNAQSAAHSTGSPGFLRGRGRGRPKLIGDELDADLVDYMVSLKNADPHGGHFTASQALNMARHYILERAPGLLEEHGGHVKLKLTWAMKLVSRIGERQREIEYGLPAGTLSNMGRNLTNLPGGNFMADVMATNIFSHQLMMVNQQMKETTPSEDAKTAAKSEERAQNEENLNVKSEATSSIPEIVNIKELNIPFLNNFLAELNDNHVGLIDGEVGATSA